MESFFSRGGLPIRRLSRLYNDTKKSSDFVQEPSQAADDPEIKALHRKLRIQKDRLVSWGLEWSDPSQTAEIDESLSKAGLTDLVGSIMATIKDILAEAEPLWLASKRPAGTGKAPEKASGDRKVPLIVWDKGRFEDLVKDLTASIDTLCDLSRTRSSVASTTSRQIKSSTSMEELKPYSSTRIQTPQQVDPQTLTSLRTMQALPISGLETSPDRLQQICFMSKQAYTELTRRQGRQAYAPLLVEYAQFDPIYSSTGIMPEMTRFEKISAGLQTESHRAPGTWIGLPLLLGYYEDMENSRLALIYQFPPAFNPVTYENLTQNPLDNLCTLAELLSRPDFEPTLEAKFRLAYNLSNTVFDMHARGITHGNLYGSTISFCNTVGNDSVVSVGEVDIRRPLISSFDIFSDAPVQDPARSNFLLHRHPLDSRTTVHSPFASKSENKTLDLYSLAMMLVSIGLWSRLENLVPNGDSPSLPESVLHQLAIRCGTPYMKAVQACWNAVDHELARSNAVDEIIHQVQTRTSRYLEACCILDGISELDERLGDEYAKTQSATEKTSDPSGASHPGPSLTSGARSGPESMVSTTLEKSNPMISNPRKPTESKSFEKTQPEYPDDPPPKLRLYPQIPLPSDIIEQWNNTLMPQINMALRHFYRKNPESVEISLESIGESPQKTTPTVLVVCTSVGKVRAILMKKLGILFDGSTGFSLKVCRGSVLRSRKRPERSMAGSTKSVAGDDENPSEAGEEEPTAANANFQERPHNGASIGAWIGDKHLPPVSFGGLVMVDDKPYGMTVHHMLDDPDAPFIPNIDSEDVGQETKRANAPPMRSSAAGQEMYLREGDSSAESSSGDDYACEFSDTESEFSATDITSDDEDDEEDEYTEPGDIPGIEAGFGDGYIITQPALDDVADDFYPSEECRDDDHLATCSLGEVYASSGIRRREEDGMVHEIDWALFEFLDNRLPEENFIPRALMDNTRSSTRPGALQPTEVAPFKCLPGLEVQCIARTSGLQTGRILPALTSVKIFGRTSPSQSYQVSGRASAKSTERRGGTSLGVPGDSGAWVIDRTHGRVCGHVLAWSERKQVAYICPMDVLLLDIAERLGLDAWDVRLPRVGEDFFVAKVRASDDIHDSTEVVEISDVESWDDEGNGDDDDNDEIPQLEQLSLR